MYINLFNYNNIFVNKKELEKIEKEINRVGNFIEGIRKKDPLDWTIVDKFNLKVYSDQLMALRDRIDRLFIK